MCYEVWARPLFFCYKEFDHLQVPCYDFPVAGLYPRGALRLFLEGAGSDEAFDHDSGV